jgi:homoserine O-succinyltransferase
MYHYYGINKKPLEKKCFGVFEHDVKDKKSKLFHGFDEVYLCPHSRHTMVDKKDIEAVKELLILSESEEAGVNICATKDYKEIYVFGHMEYDKETLGKEYFRDVEQGLDINIPKNYFLNDDPTEKIVRRWHAHAQLFYSNWLNYCVYQETPFVLTVPEEQMQ